MEVELRRAWFLEPYLDGECAVCGESIVCESVWAAKRKNSDEPYEQICPECLEYLGKRNPEKFPTIEEYEEAKRLHPETLWAGVDSPDELLERDEDAYWELLDTEDISREDLQWAGGCG